MRFRLVVYTCVHEFVYLMPSRDSTPSKYALSDTELTKLKEKAKELSRIREKMRALQDEVSAQLVIPVCMVGII